MPSLTLGIVAHVDAGKTSLTERLLYEAGVIDAPGRVDDGTTRTDSMELERRRGITIRAAVTSFAIGDLDVTLVDTPGHPDFVAEVERSLGVLDAAVLVLSSVEGVQPQTVVIWRALRRIGVPTLLFINKVDRSGADVDAVVDQVRRRLTPHLVVLARAEGLGRRDARVREVELDDESVVQAVADVDDAVLTRWVDGAPLPHRVVRRALRRGVRDGAITPVLCGSATTGAGVAELRAALASVLPRAPEPEGDCAATVFAVDRDDHGRRAWVRMWRGELAVRDRVATGGPDRGLVTEVAVSRPGGLVVGPRVRAGQVAVVRGPNARVGDLIGTPPNRRVHRFAPPTLQSLVRPVDPTRRTALFAGLAELADEDPLIDLRLDAVDGEAAVRLHGEVQKEVLAALLEQRYDVQARFSPTSIVCIERVRGVGAAQERLKVDANPYLATVGLRVEPTAVGSGVRFSPGRERGNLPPAFIAATEEGARAALRQGLRGWEVTDCTVTMTSSAYYPRQSRPHQVFDKSMSTVAADFRNLTPVVLLAALARAGTQVCEPVDAFDLELPDDLVSPVVAQLGRLGAVVRSSTSGGGLTQLVGDLRSARVPSLAQRLPDISGGQAVLQTRFSHHAPVTSSPPPVRRRTGADPRDRLGWFRDVPR